MLRAALLAAAILPFLALTVQATVVTVDLMGTGDYSTIQEGLDAASPGDTVLVLPGTYTGDQNRDLDFHGDGILLVSSAGAAATIIDCQGAGRGFLFVSSEDTTTAVVGFTVLGAVPPGGSVTGAGAEIYSASPKIEDCVFSQCATQQGGGVCVRQADSAPVLRRCTFLSNSGSLGGALHVTSGMALVADCTFEGNDASRGAAAYLSLCSATFARCAFTGNEGADWGGAISTDQCPLLTFTDCGFNDNTAGQLGAAARFFQGAAAFTDCSFTGNTTPVEAGAISAYGCALTLTGCDFESNSTAGDGGAVMTVGGEVAVSGCTFTTNAGGEGAGLWCSSMSSLVMDGTNFTGNIATANGGAFFLYDCPCTLSVCTFDSCSAGDHGGAGYCWLAPGHIEACDFSWNTGGIGGGLYLRASSTQVTDCWFQGNTATSGGGAVAMSQVSAPSISDCTFIGNSTGFAQGSVLSAIESTPTLEGCTLAANTGPATFWQAASSGSVSNTIIAFTANGGPATSYGGTPDFEHCVVFGNASGDSLIGTYHDNAFVNPAFCDVAGGDVTLCENSPCLPGNNAWDEQVGAHAQGCGWCDTVVERTTWGAVKALFR